MRYVKILVALLAAGALLLLAGCGNTPSQESASSALSSPSLWYMSQYPAGTKVAISQILYFSSGKVTAYNTSQNFTYSQVIGKSQQAILTDALSMDKSQFEKSVQSDVSYFDQVISSQKSIIQEANVAMGASSAQGNAAARESQISNAQAAIEAAQKSIANVQAAAFQAPSPVPYTLSGSTLSFSAPEASGGQAASSCTQSISCSAVLSSPYKDQQFSFSLSPAPVVQAEGKSFSGFRVGVGSSATYLQTEADKQFEL
ncbi:MAG: hypothetical protein J6P35_01625 [Aeriscardovia sp.]|nr:hypothetical protein [Aeriscardovia sp.]